MVSGSFIQNYRSFPYFESVEYNFDNVSSSLYGTAIYFIENAAKIRVISIPKNQYGTGISPHTFELSGSNFLIKDDGEGNLFDYALTEARYSGTPYVDPNNRYAGPNLEVPVGNVFYNHGIAVITNVDYICFIDAAPVARNTYINLLNTQEEKIIPTLLGDFDDCTSLNTSSVITFTNPGYNFPDYSISASGDLIITPNQISTTPGEYRLFYSVENEGGLVSNTGSIILNLTTQLLTSEILSVTQSCYEGTLSSSVTFSINQGLPPYSYSIDNTNYTSTNDYISTNSISFTFTFSFINIIC
jgi:hypothetical protein